MRVNTGVTDPRFPKGVPGIKGAAKVCSLQLALNFQLNGQIYIWYNEWKLYWVHGPGIFLQGLKSFLNSDCKKSLKIGRGLFFLIINNLTFGGQSWEFIKEILFVLVDSVVAYLFLETCLILGLIALSRSWFLYFFSFSFLFNLTFFLGRKRVFFLFESDLFH